MTLKTCPHLQGLGVAVLSTKRAGVDKQPKNKCSRNCWKRQQLNSQAQGGWYFCCQAEDLTRGELNEFWPFFRFCPSVKTPTEGYFFQNKITDRDERETAVKGKKEMIRRRKGRKPETTTTTKKIRENHCLFSLNPLPISLICFWSCGPSAEEDEAMSLNKLWRGICCSVCLYQTSKFIIFSYSINVLDLEKRGKTSSHYANTAWLVCETEA